MNEEQLLKKIEDLEYTVARQDVFIEELNKALSEQQEELLELNKQFKMLLNIFKQQQNDEGTVIENTPPPHYNQSF